MDTFSGLVAEAVSDKAADYLEIENIPFLSKSKKRKLEHILQGWRALVTGGGLIAFLVLCANLALLAWAEAKGQIENGRLISLYSGDCNKTRTIFTWVHLSINILSTLLLAASNTACQCLTAPTRQEIDIAHSYFTWLDVGISSFRNLKWIHLKRVVLYLLLSSSSIPLHLTYNSIIFPTTSTNEPVTLLVQPDFNNGGHYSIPAKSLPEFAYSDPVSRPHGDKVAHQHLKIRIHEIQEKAKSSELHEIGLESCANEMISNFVSNYRSFVLVSTDPVKSSNNLLGYGVRPTLQPWIAFDWRVDCTAGDDWRTCDSQQRSYAWLRGLTEWALKTNLPDNKTQLVGSFTSIDACYAEPTTPQCTLELSETLLIVVIIFNVVKFCCFLLALTWADEKSLVTVGDAIDSFLQRPDPATAGLGAFSVVDIRWGGWNSVNRAKKIEFGTEWSSERHFWFRSSSAGRWTITGVLCLGLLIGGVYLSIISASGKSPSKLWSLGFGTINLNYVVAKTTGTSALISNVLLANTPQLIVSFAYLFYNNILTGCLLAAEYCDYGAHRKSLRVTDSQRDQRTTYWLQLPYRYAVPLIIAFMVLHWLISQSIFLVQVTEYSFWSQSHRSGTLSGCGFSPISVIFATILGALIVVALFINGFRRYPANVPIVASCTAAISAACHTGVVEGEDISEKPLQYGALKSCEALPGSPRRVGFSADEVEFLRDGEVYR